MSTDLSARLADACDKLRRTPMPIADLIPMIQASKDALEQQAAEITTLRTTVECLEASCRGALKYSDGQAAEIARLRALHEETSRLMQAAIAENVAMTAERDALRPDAKRLDWLRDNLFEHKWNGIVGKGCAVQWQVAPDFRFKQRELTDTSGILAGDFRRAIDAARAAREST